MNDLSRLCDKAPVVIKKRSPHRSADTVMAGNSVFITGLKCKIDERFVQEKIGMRKGMVYNMIIGLGI